MRCLIAIVNSLVHWQQLIEMRSQQTEDRVRWRELAIHTHNHQLHQLMGQAYNAT